MSFSLPPIVKQAERLLLEIEKAVRSFPRYEKYGCGTDLRAQARKVSVLTHRAWRQQRARLALVKEWQDFASRYMRPWPDVSATEFAIGRRASQDADELEHIVSQHAVNGG